jgi:sugar O-acyltransferase (sialic acid O-acetyltransferase NeuD family)
MAEPLVVFGSGGHAKVVVEAVLARTPAREIILLDDDPDRHGRTVLGIAVHGGRDSFGRFGKAPTALGIGDNRARAAVLDWLRDAGHELETVIHPAAVVGRSVDIGSGAFVGAGAVIIADAQIGAGAIINTCASVDHDCLIGEAAHIGPGAHLCGGVRIGARVLVGVGASIRPGISVSDDVVLGAGSVVIRSITGPGTFVGNPARPLR